MSVIERMKGIDLPISVSLEDRFGSYSFYAPGEDIEDTGDGITGNQKGQWWKENSGKIIQALPELYCAIFPKKCQGNRGSNSAPPVVIQQGGQKDWVTTGLLVVIVVVLIFVVLKK